MRYLKTFGLLTENMEQGFFNSFPRTCFTNYYPFLFSQTDCSSWVIYLH